MQFSDVLDSCPNTWFPMNVENTYEVFELNPFSHEYKNLQDMLRGNYYTSVEGLFKIQNPLEYARFKLKCEEYAQRGEYQIRQLFHDTAEHNINSIALHNFQIVCATRCRMGSGIYFCSNPNIANRRSNKLNGESRAMFVVDVLIQKPLFLNENECCLLPKKGYDTVIGGTNATTYVKYFDSEFYPSYVMTYVNKR